MKRPVLLFLCISLAWTLACALVASNGEERQLWARQLVASTAVRQVTAGAPIVVASPVAIRGPTLVAGIPPNPRATSLAEVWTPVVLPPVMASSAQVVTRASVASVASVAPPVRAASSSSAVPTPTISSTLSTAPIRVSTRANRELSSALSSMASSSVEPSAPFSSASAAASETKENASFVSPSSKLFPLAVIMFICIGLLSLLLTLLAVKWFCHRKRSDSSSDYGASDSWDFSRSLGRSQSKSDLMGSPESFDADEKSGAWSMPPPQQVQQDNGMRPAPLTSTMGFVSQPYSAPAPPSSANSTRAHQTHRRTATIILPPTPAVRPASPQRQLSMPPSSLRPASPLSAAPPARVSAAHFAPSPLYQHPHQRTSSVNILPSTLPPVPAAQPLPRPPSQMQARVPMPHQPRESSGLRYMYGERSTVDLEGQVEQASRGVRFGAAETRMLG